MLKIVDFNLHHLYLTPPLKMMPLEFRRHLKREPWMAEPIEMRFGARLGWAQGTMY